MKKALGLIFLALSVALVSVLMMTPVSMAAGDVAGLSKVDALIAMEDIKQTKARYFRCMDSKDWDCFEDTLAPDIDFNVSGALYAINGDTGELIPSGDCIEACDPANIDQSLWQRNGAADVRNWEQTTLFGFQTFHQGSMPEITLTSATTATATFSLEHYLRARPTVDDSFVYFATNGRTDAGQLHGYGRYIEEYVKGNDGKWRIKKLRFVTYKVDLEYRRR